MTIVKNTTHISKKAYLHYYWYSLRSNIRLMVIIVCLFVFGGLTFYLQMRSPSSYSASNPTVFVLILLILFALLVAWIFFATPLRSYKKVKTIVNTFSFESDGIHIQTQTDGANAQATYQYKTVVKALEKKNAFYLYIDKRRAFILDKEGFTEAGPEELREILGDKMGKKFK